jgi:hypothetical protein
VHVLGTVPGHIDEPQGFEHRFQHAPLGRGEFDELEAIQAHRIVVGFDHDCVSFAHLLLPYRTPLPKQEYVEISRSIAIIDAKCQNIDDNWHEIAYLG